VEGLKSYVWLSILVVGVIWLSAGVHAMGAGNTSEEGTGVVILHKQDNGRELQVKSGDVIRVELAGAGATGYWWYAAGLDSARIELVSEETSPLSSDKKLLGGPVIGVWRFKAKEPGKTNLTMKYYRVWEGPEKAVDQFSVTLTIR
jgi:predicted secreted protein